MEVRVWAVSWSEFREYNLQTKGFHTLVLCFECAKYLLLAILIPFPCFFFLFCALVANVCGFHKWTFLSFIFQSFWSLGRTQKIKGCLRVIVGTYSCILLCRPLLWATCLSLGVLWSSLPLPITLPRFQEFSHPLLLQHRGVSLLCPQ